MADLLTANDHQLVPGLTEPWLSIFFEAANSAVDRLAPCLTADGADSGRRAEAKLIVLRAIDRVRQTPEFIRAQRAGTQSIEYATGGRGLLDRGDRAALSALCSSIPTGGAVGAFPAPGNYGHLFASPRAWMGP